MLDVIVVGLTMVFFIFVILYFTFILMGWVFTKRVRMHPTGPTVRVVEEDEEIVAVISAALREFLGEGFVIRKLRRKDRGFVYWIRTGWRGVGRWQRNTGWS